MADSIPLELGFPGGPSSHSVCEWTLFKLGSDSFNYFRLAFDNLQMGPEASLLQSLLLCWHLALWYSTSGFRFLDFIGAGEGLWPGFSQILNLSGFGWDADSVEASWFHTQQKWNWSTTFKSRSFIYYFSRDSVAFRFVISHSFQDKILFYLQKCSAFYLVQIWWRRKCFSLKRGSKSLWLKINLWFYTF